MSNIEGIEQGSASNAQRARSGTTSTLQEQQEGERTPRPSIRREESNTSSRFDDSSSRLRLPGPARTSSEQETTRLLSRDFADQDPEPRLRHVRSSAISFRQPSIRRRLGSAQPSPSPGPSHSWRHFVDSDRRSVAIAASGRDNDTASRRFSLAGPAPLDTLVANQPYVDPGYAQLNPAYDQPANTRPIWGLAKPLPHVLRSGMVPTKDELKQEVLHRDDRPESIADLETGRIEPSLRPGKIAAQLDDVRRGRELHLFETFHHQRPGSPAFSPFGRYHKESAAHHDISELHSRLGEPIIEEEDEEYQHRKSDPELAGLDEAIANANRAKEAEHSIHLPYQDAIPLFGYEAEDDEVHNLHTYWSVVRLLFREPLAELLGYTLGFSANLALTVSRGAAGVGDTGDWAWGLATMIAIYIAGGISGAHLNPAISIMLHVYRGFPLAKMPAFITAQMVGAFLATLITFAIFRPGLIALQVRDLNVQGQHSATFEANAMPPASVVLANFLTFPRQAWVSTGTAFLTELVGSTILAISVLALGDDTNAPPGAGMNAFIVGLLVAVLGMAFGYNTGLAMNPARDFGPRVALAVLGYSSSPYPSLFADGYWFRVNWIAPICGTVLGGFLYDSMIFIGGESPVNYPAERIGRAVRKWVKRWQARIGRTKQKIGEIKDEVVG
ncbi:Protein kinase domain-containing protein ppk32 [Lithohypha guttulata]|uniref:Protein kinase domain-containing protein ppk32 n=1 Tax=Lithohypha guttulata TaxID=1690604 RepID=UPI002DDEED91|nr:Protein kinase domain-containing protein ppk32 [Lithohypha guttulata]KAK5106713.1 Protein kinase domain-containing protein ppk32 [Lithohypha guttulata]